MSDAFLGLLPYLPNLPSLAGLLLIATYLGRLWLSAVNRLKEEGEAHRLTNVKLDAERERRRKVEDEMDQVTREARALKAENGQLRTRLGEPA